MFFSGFLLQGLHLRLHFDDHMPTCPQRRTGDYPFAIDSDVICNQTFDNTGVDSYKIAVSGNISYSRASCDLKIICQKQICLYIRQHNGCHENENMVVLVIIFEQFYLDWLLTKSNIQCNYVDVLL